MTPSFSTVKQFNWPELMLPIKTMCKIKLRSVGLCYLNGVERRSGTSLYRSAPSLSKFKQLNWPELMFPIKYVNELLLTMCKIKLRLVGLCYLSSTVIGITDRYQPVCIYKFKLLFGLN